MNETLPKRPGNVVLKASEAEAWIDGFAFRERAERQGAALIASTEAAVAKAREEGFREGMRVGESEAGALLLRTSADVDRYLAGLEAQLTDLALGIVRKVVGRFDDAELVAACAREALGSFRGETRIVVRVAPDLVGAVRAQMGSGVGVEGDPGLAAGRCVIASPLSSVEVGLDAQLDAIRAAMLDGSRAS